MISAGCSTYMLSHTILLTIDVEDWFQVENLRPWFPVFSWNNYPLRVERNTHRLLDLFDSFQNPGVKATFFTLGWIAEKIPWMVEEIHRRGHEVASHGYGHMMCNQISAEDLKEDLYRSKSLLEDITGIEIRGYRAPNFSVNQQVLDTIRNTGYRYDSSYNDFSMHGRYGKLNTDGRQKNGIALCLGDDFHEIPISNINLGPQVMPWGGGGYFRLIPFQLFRLGIQHILENKGAYMFYLHPWELDPDQPRVQQSKGLNTWRHYLNLKHTYSKLTHLITSFKHCRFMTCNQYIRDIALKS